MNPDGSSLVLLLMRRRVLPLCLLLLLLSGSPAQAQRGVPISPLDYLFDRLHLVTGLLVSPGAQMRRTDLPYSVGLSFSLPRRTGGRVELAIGYSAWSESPSYRDYVSRILDPSDPAGIPTGGIVSTDLEVRASLLLPVRHAGWPVAYVGPLLGWSRYDEEWRQGIGPSGASRRELFGGLHLAIPLSVPRAGSTAAFWIRRRILTLETTSPLPLSDPDGVWAVLAVPLGAGYGSGGTPTRGASEREGAAPPFRLGLRYGIPRSIPGPIQTGAITGVSVIVPLASAWVLVGSLSSFGWQTDDTRARGGDEPFLAPESQVPADWAGLLFLPEGRTWELGLGLGTPDHAIGPVAIQAVLSIGLRRQEEWWRFFYPWRDNFGSVDELPPAAPGVEIDGVFMPGISILLGHSQQVPAIGIVRVLSAGRVWSNGRPAAIDVDGWRLVIEIPLGPF